MERHVASRHLATYNDTHVLFYFTVEPSYERTSKTEKLRFSLMGQRHVCTYRHAQRAAYRTAISAAQILVFYFILLLCIVVLFGAMGGQL